MEEQNSKVEYLRISQTLQNRHEEIKKEMVRILDANKVLEDQYILLEKELTNVEKQYVDNLKNLID